MLHKPNIYSAMTIAIATVAVPMHMCRYAEQRDYRQFELCLHAYIQKHL